MSRIGEWIRDDLRRVNTPTEVVHTVRAFPILLLKAVLNFVVSLLAIYVLLAVFGHADAFGDWWWLAGIWTGSAVGSMIHGRKTEVRQR